MDRCPQKDFSSLSLPLCRYCFMGQAFQFEKSLSLKTHLSLPLGLLGCKEEHLQKLEKKNILPQAQRLLTNVSFISFST